MHQQLSRQMYPGQDSESKPAPKPNKRGVVVRHTNVGKALSPAGWNKVPRYLSDLLTPDGLAIWMIVKSHCIKGESCKISLDRIRQISGLSRQHILDVISDMEEHGFLRVLRRHRAVTQYWPLMPYGDGCKEESQSSLPGRLKGSQTDNSRVYPVDSTSLPGRLKTAQSSLPGRPQLEQDLSTNYKDPAKAPSVRGDVSGESNEFDELLATMKARWETERGQKYFVDIKDRSALKRLVAQYEHPTILERWEQFLQDDSSWLQERGYRIVDFVDRINGYGIRSQGGLREVNPNDFA